MSERSPQSRPLICPRCEKPLVDFDAPPPEETGTTCNPINSPACWRKTPLREQKDEFDYLYAETTGKEWGE